jgi:hypothetical protein
MRQIVIHEIQFLLHLLQIRTCTYFARPEWSKIIFLRTAKTDKIAVAAQVSFHHSQVHALANTLHVVLVAHC